MKVFTSVTDPEITRILHSGGVGVLRTDTLYGVVAKADNEPAVQRVYDLKSRDETKSPIVLISSTKQLFDQPSDTLIQFSKTVWPGPVSIIFPSINAPIWLRRDNNSVAYRLPDNAQLLELLSSTGPLIAPSANPEGDAPAMSLAQAVSYFGDDVDFYVDGGEVSDASPSRLLQVGNDGQVTRLR